MKGKGELEMLGTGLGNYSKVLAVNLLTVLLSISTIAIIGLLLLSHDVAAGINGEKLYRQHCSVCHGSEGQGGVGIPLNLQSFLNNTPDSYLSNTIRLGRPGRIMPSFSYLSEQEIKAIISHLRGWQENPSKLHFSDAKITGNSKRGAQLYQKNCVSCHGENGQGGMGTGVTFSRPRGLPILPPALNNQGFLASASDQMLWDVIAKGREGTPMPSMKRAGLSNDQISDLVSHIRSWQEPLDLEKIQINSDGKEAEIEKTEQGEQRVSPIVEYQSPNSMEDTIEAIKMAATGRNFRYIREQTLDNGLVAQNDENKRQQIYYFCNFEFLNQALSIDPRIGMFLPFRISIVEEDSQVTVMTVNPEYLCDAFNNSELKPGCEKMAEDYAAILEEGTF